LLVGLLRIENRLRQLFDVERHAVGTVEDCLDNILWQWRTHDVGGDPGGGLARKAVERQARRVRMSVYLRRVVRPTSEQRQDWRPQGSSKHLIEEFERGRAKPLGVLDDQEYRSLPCQAGDLRQQTFESSLTAASGIGLGLRWIALDEPSAGRDQRERYLIQIDSLFQQLFELGEPRRGVIVGA
jgi:hypothetical protein